MARPLQPHSIAGQLRYWSLHCSLTALPSFVIAISYFDSTLNILGMLAGIATFIVGYTAITSTPLYGKLHGGIVGRSVRLGTRTRMILSLIGLPFLIPMITEPKSHDSMGIALFTIDFWFGYAAIMIVGVISGALVMSPVGRGSGAGNAIHDDFLLTYVTTIIEGLLISVSLVLIAFFVLIILNARQKRRVYQPPSVPPDIPPRQ